MPSSADPSARSPGLQLELWRRAVCVREGAAHADGLAGLDRWRRPLDARLALVPVRDGRPAGMDPDAPLLEVLIAAAFSRQPPRLVRKRLGPLLRLGSRRHHAPLALLAGAGALKLDGHAVLPLRRHRLLAAPLDDEAALTALCAAAEAARDQPDRLLLTPLVPATGPWPWAPWAPPPGSPLSRRRDRLRALQDIDDYDVQHEALQLRDEAAGHIRHWSRLRIVRQAAGIATAARWMPFETVLPAADLLHVVVGEEIWEVWTDSVLDVFSAETRPLANHWPPRFVTRGGFPQAALGRLRGTGRLVQWTRAAPVTVEEG